MFHDLSLMWQFFELALWVSVAALAVVLSWDTLDHSHDTRADTPVPCSPPDRA